MANIDFLNLNDFLIQNYYVKTRLQEEGWFFGWGWFWYAFCKCWIIISQAGPNKKKIFVLFFVFSLFSKSVYLECLDIWQWLEFLQNWGSLLLFRSFNFVDISSRFESEVSGEYFWDSKFNSTLLFSRGKPRLQIFFNPKVFSINKVYQCMKGDRNFLNSGWLIDLPFVRHFFQFLLVCQSSSGSFITLMGISCRRLNTSEHSNWLFNFQNVMA